MAHTTETDEFVLETDVITAIIVAFVVELARGHSGSPTPGWERSPGLAYLIAIIVFRLRG